MRYKFDSYSHKYSYMCNYKINIPGFTHITFIRVDHIHIFRKQSHSHSFKCYIQIKIEDLQKLEELAALKNEVKVVRLQDNLGEQYFHEDMKKVFEPVTEFFKDVSEEVTKSMTENSIKNNKALNKLNNKLLEIMNDRGILTTYLMSPLSKITNLENTSQFRVLKFSSSN